MAHAFDEDEVGAGDGGGGGAGAAGVADGQLAFARGPPLNGSTVGRTNRHAKASLGADVIRLRPVPGLVLSDRGRSHL